MMKKTRSDIQQHVSNLPTKTRVAKVVRVETPPVAETDVVVTAEAPDIVDVQDIKPVNVPKPRKAPVKRAARTQK